MLIIVWIHCNLKHRIKFCKNPLLHFFYHALLKMQEMNGPFLTYLVADCLTLIVIKNTSVHYVAKCLVFIVISQICCFFSVVNYLKTFQVQSYRSRNRYRCFHWSIYYTSLINTKHNSCLNFGWEKFERI